MPDTDARTGYAPIGDLNMYYEIHGSGTPLSLLHGAYMTIDMMGPILRGLAKQRQPNPNDFPNLVEKLKQLDTTPFAWPEEDIRAIAAPTLIVLGDSDGVRLEHAVELFRLRGGGVMGDLAGLPQSQLAVLPGTAHFVPPGFGLLDRAGWLLAMIPPFLDASMPEDS